MSVSRFTRWLVAFFGVAVLILTISSAANIDPQNYRQSVEKWRSAYAADLNSDTGWLTVAGLFWLHEGENTFGSAASNSIVLPASAPPQAGTFYFHDGKTIVRINPGVSAELGGKPLQQAELKPDFPNDYVVLGDLTLLVHASGPRLSIRLKDKNSKFRREFTALKWFPIDPAYRVDAQYVAYPSPKELDSQNVLGDPIKLKITGYVAFTLQGSEIHLDAGPKTSGGLFIVFRDLTSGKETYPASRFLDTLPPQDGPSGKTVELDFNEAYNPPCAYNPFTTCPLPLPGNRLKIPISAGEKLYKQH